MKKYLEILGTIQRDVVSGIDGMVSSVCFDAYGCVQAALARPVKKDGTLPESFWIDVKRLKPAGRQGKLRIMPTPDFGEPGTEAGPAEKPAPRI